MAKSHLKDDSLRRECQVEKEQTSSDYKEKNDGVNVQAFLEYRF